jgi:putative transposase
VQAEAYLLHCYRYIELNPVRAGIVANPVNYEWSSYRANAEGRGGSFLTPHDEYLRLGTEEGERRRIYRSLFDSPSEQAFDAIRDATRGNIVAGDETFKARLASVPD